MYEVYWNTVYIINTVIWRFHFELPIIFLFLYIHKP